MPDKQTPALSLIISEGSEPSRRALLVLMLLVSIREKQGRWLLDQDLMGDMVFDQNLVSALAISAFIAGHTTTSSTLHYVKTKPGGNDHAQNICSAEQKQNPPDTDTRNR